MVKLGQTYPKCNSFYSDTGSYFVFMSSTVPRTPQTRPPSIATPCIKACVVDGASSLCLGCFRTLSEIGGWSGLSEDQRATIMAELPGRAAQTGRVPGSG